MIRLLFTAPIVLTLAAICVAQEQEAPHVNGYLFAAPGVVSGAGTLAFGAGGEGALFHGLGTGVEIGYLGPAAGLGDGFGLLSTNASYFIGKPRKLVPFVTGGYSLAFRNGTGNMANFGAGFTYWANRHHGIRLEVRDHIPTEGVTTHFVNFRIGYAFR